MPATARKTAATIVSLLAIALATPAAADRNATLGFDDARHLLARTGFGPTAAEVQAIAPLTRTEAVDRLLRETRTAPITPPPASMLATTPLRPPGPSATVEERLEFARGQRREGFELRAWWIAEMAQTPSPLTERMTLFWHNHFVSSQQKVRLGRLMHRQNETLRANALGSFATLLHAAAKDGAMLVYLDAFRSRAGAPNENFAREVMELFTLGEGRYTEQDVREAARAFTGWSLDRDSGLFVFRRALHDSGTKVVLGERGRFDGDRVLDILLAQDATAEHIVAKLWREYVSPEPDQSEVRRIAAHFRASDYSIKVALRELLLGDAFWASTNRGTLVRSPVELVVGTLRQLAIPPGDGFALAVASAGMGQALFAPPNVKGWPGGDAWINASTLLARKQFLERISRADPSPSRGMTDDGGMQAVAAADDDDERRRRVARLVDRRMRELAFDPAAWLAVQPGATPGDKARAAQALLLPLPSETPLASDASPSSLVRATLLEASYQLK